MIGRRIYLITGGTGSIGREVVNLLQDHEVRVFSRDDSKQAFMADELGRKNVRYLIGDVRDLDRLRLAMRGVTHVVHAAAMKHVHACEYNPFEATQTNVVGTQNVIQAATEADVEAMVLVSTDKAADPTTTLGASKLMAERLMVDASRWAKTRLCVARLGNVWDSRGSFPDRARALMAAGKPIKVTDPEADRLIIQKADAGAFVLKVLDYAERGAVYVPLMERISVADMLERIGVPADYPREVVGLGAGEKKSEEIMSFHERPGDTVYPWGYRVVGR